MEEKEVTNEELARMISKGFDGMQSQFNSVQEQFNGVQEQFVGINGRLERVEEDLDYLKYKVNGIDVKVNGLVEDHVTRLEFEDSLSRIKLLEKKAGIESGK